MTMAILEVTDLSVYYGNIQALNDVSVAIEAGEHVAVLGPNGAGKTTLMRAIIGHAPVAAGHVTFRGTDITTLPSWERAKRGLAYIPEGGRVFPDATVRQNLETGAYLETDKAAIRDRLATVFEFFPRLEERASQRASTLSGGEQQMLAIGRAMMSDPELILVDEITMGLMPLLVDRAFEVLAALNDNGIALLQVEQNVPKTLAVADRAYLLENGQIVDEGTPTALAESGAIEESYLGVSQSD